MMMLHYEQTRRAQATVQVQQAPQHLSRLLALALMLGFVAQLFVFAGTAAAATPTETQAVAVVQDGLATASVSALPQPLNDFSLPQLTSALTQAVRAYLPTVSATANTVYQCILEPEGNVQ